MKPVVIFGTGTVAEVVAYYFKHHSEREVAGFAIDEAYRDGDRFFELPLVPFGEVTRAFPPGQYAMFIAVGYHDLNKLRAQRLSDARQLGYEIISFVHPSLDLPRNITYGDNCFLMDQASIQPFVRLGENVFVWGGATIGHHSVIGDNCWIASCANIAGRVEVGKNCFLAVNATVGNHIRVGDDCFLGSNTLLTKDLADGQVLVEPSTKPFRLNSRQFLRMSNFKNL